MNRLAQEKDLDQIQKLIEKFTFIQKYVIKDFINKNRIYVYEEEGFILSTIIFNANFNTVMYIVTKESFSKKGIGACLFKFAVSNSNINALIIKATADIKWNSVKFWEKLDFKQTGKTYITKTGKQLKEMVWYRYSKCEVQL